MEQKIQPEKKSEERIIRILSKDIRGGMTVYAGLTKIKGVSWSFANAVCNLLKLDKRRKIGSLSKEEIAKISDFIKNPQLPYFLLNRKSDFKTGENKHMAGSDLELQTEFDIKKLKKIKSYRGYRHALGLPTRGQRTKGNFRKHRARGVGIKKKHKKPENEIKKVQ